jgi:hypothetical protein
MKWIYNLWMAQTWQEKRPTLQPEYALTRRSLYDCVINVYILDIV